MFRDSGRIAKTALLVASADIVANELQGMYLHARGFAQKPGGSANARYNIETKPPVSRRRAADARQRQSSADHHGQRCQGGTQGSNA